MIDLVFRFFGRIKTGANVSGYKKAPILPVEFHLKNRGVS
jgi:hypothetical protein